MKEFASLTIVAIEIGKRQFFHYLSNGFSEEKNLHQKYEAYRYKISLKILSWLDKY